MKLGIQHIGIDNFLETHFVSMFFCRRLCNPIQQPLSVNLRSRVFPQCFSQFQRLQTLIRARPISTCVLNQPLHACCSEADLCCRPGRSDARGRLPAVPKQTIAFFITASHKTVFVMLASHNRNFFPFFPQYRIL